MRIGYVRYCNHCGKIITIKNRYELCDDCYIQRNKREEKRRQKKEVTEE